MCARGRAGSRRRCRPSAGDNHKPEAENNRKGSAAPPLRAQKPEAASAPQAAPPPARAQISRFPQSSQVATLLLRRRQAGRPEAEVVGEELRGHLAD